MGDIDIKKSKFLFLALIFIAGAVFSLSKIAIYLYDGIKSKNTYAHISERMETAGIIGENADEEGDKKKADITALSDTFDEMTSINGDYVGYIYISDTNIRYPIVRGSDNEYYLNHNIYGEKSVMGSIFMDYRNNSRYEDDNTVIYGHNMKDGSMFNNLMKFKDESFALGAEPILILTRTECLEYIVFAAYKVDKDADYIKLSFDDEKGFDKYLSSIMDRADVSIADDIKFGDRLLTLSTCENLNSNYRYVIHAVLRR